MGGRVCVEISILPTTVSEVEPGEVVDVEAQLLEVVEADDGLEVQVEQPDAPTPRELDVLRLIAQGYTNRQTAEALGIAVRTVESHRANLLAKWHIVGRAALIQEGRQRGCI